MKFTVAELCVVIAAFELADGDLPGQQSGKFTLSVRRRFMAQLQKQDPKTFEVMCRIFSS